MPVPIPRPGILANAIRTIKQFAPDMTELPEGAAYEVAQSRKSDIVRPTPRIPHVMNAETGEIVSTGAPGLLHRELKHSLPYEKTARISEMDDYVTWETQSGGVPKEEYADNVIKSLQEKFPNKKVIDPYSNKIYAAAASPVVAQQAQDKQNEPPEWEGISKSPQYLQLDGQERAEAKSQYFEQVIMPKAKDAGLDETQLQEAFNQFFIPELKHPFAANATAAIDNWALGVMKTGEGYQKDPVSLFTKGIPDALIQIKDMLEPKEMEAFMAHPIDYIKNNSGVGLGMDMLNLVPPMTAAAKMSKMLGRAMKPIDASKIINTIHKSKWDYEVVSEKNPIAKATKAVNDEYKKKSALNAIAEHQMDMFKSKDLPQPKKGQLDLFTNEKELQAQKQIAEQASLHGLQLVVE